MATTAEEDALNAEIAVLSGGRAGTVVRLDRTAVSVGRNSGVDLRFDPAADLDVSGRHAVFTRSGDGSWILRDLGSTNGTFVNGQRLAGERVLATGDRVRFGAAGPEVEFRELNTAASGSRRRWLLAFPLLLLAVAAGIAFQASRHNALLEGERITLQERIDSLTTARAESILALEDEVRDLAAALQESREEARQASIRLEQAQRSGNAAEIATLRAQLEAATNATTATPGQTSEDAAGLDLLEIQRLNRHAVAVIWVENETGGISTGTAFAVRPDATLITSRHVVAGEDGTMRPRRIAIQFSDSDQVWPARILAISADADLAVVKVDNILGTVPTVRSLTPRPGALRAGSVVASIGFPGGRGPAAAGANAGAEFASPLLSAGIIAAITPDRLEFQGYGAAGASGSPVFDASGSVVAVLFGGLTDRAHPTLVGVPVSAVTALLEQIR